MERKDQVQASPELPAPSDKGDLRIEIGSAAENEPYLPLLVLKRFIAFADIVFEITWMEHAPSPLRYISSK